jgi:type I restriction enzyme R subunit
MSPHEFTEDQLVEQPAIQLFASMNWETVSALEETFGPSGILAREVSGDVVLTKRLSAAIRQLNAAADDASVAAVIDEVTRDRSHMSIIDANREIYALLKDGVPVSMPDPATGGQKIERLKLVDWNVASNNDFLLASQMTVTGDLYTCRPDLIGFVNGLPWIVIEFKKPGVAVRAAFDENLTHYKQQIPKLFWYNALLLASNGLDSKVGSLTADWERFSDWKRAESEDEPRRVSLEVALRGVCHHERLLDLVENFTLFSDHESSVVKIVAQNHQFLGVNNAIKAFQEARSLGHGRGGVFWQTQGSGKSYSMVFFAQKVLRKLRGDWSFVIVTDRVELDEQIAKTFKAVGAISTADADSAHATSGANLRELLRGNNRYVFTLIHKFQTPEVLCDRRDVVVLTDEAHRSQYDTLALNMRAALPKATFLAFTGTPLIAGEERTKEVFGDYVSIYDFQQSIEDGATVPLYYENRTPELQLINPRLTEDIYDLIESADLNEDEEAKLDRVLGRQYDVITRDDRLDTVGRDIVQHFLGRGFRGKAMVVCIDKATALRMHDKVRRFWAEERSRVEAELAAIRAMPAGEGSADKAIRDRKLVELGVRLDTLVTTDMAVIVSPGQNEIDEMRALGLDITAHRERMRNSNPGLDEQFKDSANPLRIVFVCAMWLTGFDAPSCSTVYLDKPMRNHTLMQTIARANRVFPGKHSGIIVDYANVFASLERALAIYGSGANGRAPVRDKARLAEDLREAISKVSSFCLGHGVDLTKIEQAAAGKLEKLSLVEAAVESLISPEELRKDFFAHERLVSALYKAVKPDPAAIEFTARIGCIATIAESIRAKLNPNPPDISKVMADVRALLDESIVGTVIKEGGAASLDLSKIDFEALANRFKKSTKKSTELEVLRVAVEAQLSRVLEENPTRTDFGEKFQSLIDEYNSGSRNIEQLFEQLLKLSQSLSDEQVRFVREGVTSEELVIFDILTRPSPELTAEERALVKRVAKNMLSRVREVLVINWRSKQQARAGIMLCIEDELDKLPDAYEKEIYQEKCAAVFQHVYQAYPEAAPRQ